VDLTTQSIKETQMLLEEKLGINPQLLSRTMFHGQHAINELLECTDGKLKDELSLVVPLGLWQDAATLARSKSREAGKVASELNGMITLRSEDVEKLSRRRDRAEEEAETKQQILKKLEMQVEEEKNKAQGSQGGDHTDYSELEMRLEQVKGEAMEIESRYQSITNERDEEIGPLARIFDELNSALPALYERFLIQEREVFAATMKVDSGKEKVEMLEQKWSVDLSSGLNDAFISPETCPTCFQPVSSDGDGHSHVDLKKLAEKEIDSALQNFREAQAVLESADDKLAVSKVTHSGRARTVKDMQEDLSRAKARWTEEVSEVERELSTKKHEQAQLSERLSVLARKSQNVFGLQAIEASINTERTAAKYTSEAYLALCDEVKEGGSRLEELKARMDEQNQRGRTMTELAESLGQRGIQTFVLQNVVDALQTVSQIYLDELSDGAQRLELSLDAGDRISRTAFVRGADGDYRERPLSTLSGGQWRRCSLALTLGFAELVSRRGMMRPSMIVLDEPLTHLDRSGRTKVGDVIRKMLHPEISGLGGLGMSTVLLILQDLAAEEIEEAFDRIDEVVKDGGSSFVKVDERT
jgi:DNA repair exonuclease SbcCD ATPase subunit